MNSTILLFEIEFSQLNDLRPERTTVDRESRKEQQIVEEPA